MVSQRSEPFISKILFPQKMFTPEVTMVHAQETGLDGVMSFASGHSPLLMRPFAIFLNPSASGNLILLGFADKLMNGW